MKHPKISRRVETRPYGRVSTPTGNCRKFLTQLQPTPPPPSGVDATTVRSSPVDSPAEPGSASTAPAAIPTPHAIRNRPKPPSATPASHPTAGSRPSGNARPSPLRTSQPDRPRRHQGTFPPPHDPPAPAAHPTPVATPASPATRCPARCEPSTSSHPKTHAAASSVPPT